MNEILFKDGFGQESLYIFESVIDDVIQEKFILRLKKPAIIEYSRRVEKYSIGMVNYALSINNDIKPFNSIYNKKAKMSYITENWKELLQLTLSYIYPSELSIRETDILLYSNNYLYLENLPPATPPTSAVYNFSKFYLALNGVFVHSGYDKSILGYVNIKK